MIVIDETVYETTMRVLLNAPPTVERQDAIKKLKLAMINGITRELRYANQLPALLRRQGE